MNTEIDNLNLNPEDYEKLKTNPTHTAKPLSREEKIENWNNNYLDKYNLEVRDKKETRNSKISWFIAIICLGGVLGFLYLSQTGNYKDDIQFNPNISLYSTCPECPAQNCPSCPACSPSLTCDIPSIIKIKYLNES